MPDVRKLSPDLVCSSRNQPAPHQSESIPFRQLFIIQDGRAASLDGCIGQEYPILLRILENLMGQSSLRRESPPEDNAQIGLVDFSFPEKLLQHMSGCFILSQKEKPACSPVYAVHRIRLSFPFGQEIRFRPVQKRILLFPGDVHAQKTCRLVKQQDLFIFINNGDGRFLLFLLYIGGDHIPRRQTV